MKILHIKSTLEIGGAERLMAEMLPLINKEIEVDLLLNMHVDNAFSRKLQLAGINIYSLEYSKIYSPWNIVKIVRWLRGYDIIHVHLFPSLYWVAFANIITRKSLIYTEHSTNNRRRGKKYLKYFEKWVYGKYKKIVSNSYLTEKNLKQWIGVKENDSRFIVINNGVDVKAFANGSGKKIYPYTLIMIARFAPAKDQATIIRAMKLLTEDVHLILVGDGENLDECKLLAAELNVSKRVHFVGMQSDISNWIGKADIGIQSSKWEGFGLTAVEMMVGGVPVIASDVDGLSQIVDGAGLLFPCGDYEKLAEIVKQLITDESYYVQVQRRCQERALQYDIHIMANAYMDVYRQMLYDD